MKLSIDFDPTLSPSAKRALRWIALPFGAFLGMASVAHAMLTPDPGTWIGTGKPVSAASLSGNLTQLDSRLSAAENSLKTLAGLDGGTSHVAYVPAVVAASTSGNYTGALSYTSAGVTVQGYRAGKLICEQSLGSETAHMCTPGDLVAYVEAGNTPPAGITWVAAGLGIVDTTTSTGIVNYDCRGYTTNTGDPGPPGGPEEHGHVWSSQGVVQEGDIVTCGDNHPIACCD